MTISVAILLLLWLAFGAVHLTMSSRRIRPGLIKLFGARGFLGFYSSVIVIVFVVMVFYYFGHKHSGPLLWDLRGIPAVSYLAMVLVALGFFCLAVSIAPSSASPLAMTASGMLTAKGLVRVTRHPGFIGFSLFGLAHCMVNGYLGDAIFFGGFAVWPPIGARHQERRKLVTMGKEFADFLAETSHLPFAAVLRGRQKVVLEEVNWKAGAIGLLVFAVVRFFHGPLLGP
jgi:zeta-carotene isomerase